MTIKISEYGEDFLKLALRIDKHNKGYVDFYIGPEYISQIVASESITAPIKLLNDAETIIKKLDKQGYDKVRERYLLKTLTAMKTTVELLLGYDIPFSELILKLHDIKIQPIKDSEIYKLKEDSLDKLTYQNSVRRRVNYIIFNLGYYAHVEKWSEDKLFRYANTFEIFSEKDIKNRMKILDDPVFLTTPFSYYSGSKLIIDKYGEFPQV